MLVFVATGDEEEEYWQKLIEAGKSKKGRRGRRSGGPGRGGYSWRGGRKRRQKSSASEEGVGEASPPAAKQSKSED